MREGWAKKKTPTKKKRRAVVFAKYKGAHSGKKTVPVAPGRKKRRFKGSGIAGSAQAGPRGSGSTNGENWGLPGPVKRKKCRVGEKNPRDGDLKHTHSEESRGDAARSISGLKI